MYYTLFLHGLLRLPHLQWSSQNSPAALQGHLPLRWQVALQEQWVRVSTSFKSYRVIATIKT